jgi:hypothetical protein
MHFFPRLLEERLLSASRGFGSVLLTGPRRSGKTTLLRRLFPKADYRLLEDPDILGQVRRDPRGFLESLRLPALLDEIQNAPELFSYIRSLIDAQPGKKGRWLLTGSQEAPLMKRVSESMAGRVAIFELLPFSTQEHDDVNEWRGGFPEVLARPKLADDWYRSYLRTYLERDVRAVAAIRDLAQFRQFLALVAARTAQTLNLTELAGPLGLSVPAVKQWLGILEVTGQVVIVPPYFENFGKRLVKAPKVHLLDTGMACHLLGLRSRAELERSVFLGAVFESFVASEIVNRAARTTPPCIAHRGSPQLEAPFFDAKGGVFAHGHRLACERFCLAKSPSVLFGKITLCLAWQDHPLSWLARAEAAVCGQPRARVSRKGRRDGPGSAAGGAGRADGTVVRWRGRRWHRGH